MIITHRGTSTGKKENTIAAFNHALKLGCTAIECDIRLTLDNKAVLHHDDNLVLENRKVLISKTILKYITEIELSNKEEKLVTLEELFDYIMVKNVPFFLEVKSRSQILAEMIIEKIAQNNLWERVHIIGFSFFVKTTVMLQKKYPKLKVLQLIAIPIYSYIKVPAPSYGLMVGWFDSWYTSEWLFRKILSVNRLAKLHNYYKKNGFNKVIAGVINTESGFRHFQEAGITDIVTDNLTGALKYFKADSFK